MLGFGTFELAEKDFQTCEPNPILQSGCYSLANLVHDDNIRRNATVQPFALVVAGQDEMSF